MLPIDKDFVEVADSGRPTWLVHDGKRLAKFQYVGTSGCRGYFTIVPVEKVALDSGRST